MFVIKNFGLTYLLLFLFASGGISYLGFEDDEDAGEDTAYEWAIVQPTTGSLFSYVGAIDANGSKPDYEEGKIALSYPPGNVGVDSRLIQNSGNTWNAQFTAPTGGWPMDGEQWNDDQQRWEKQFHLVLYKKVGPQYVLSGSDYGLKTIFIVR